MIRVWIGSHLEGSGRGPIAVLSRNLRGGSEGKLEETSVWTASIPAESRTEYILSTSMERYHYTSLFGGYFVVTEKAAPMEVWLPLRERNGPHIVTRWWEYCWRMRLYNNASFVVVVITTSWMRRIYYSGLHLLLGLPMSRLPDGRYLWSCSSVRDRSVFCECVFHLPLYSVTYRKGRYSTSWNKPLYPLRVIVKGKTGKAVPVTGRGSS
jgi:hypothetical protein